MLNKPLEITIIDDEQTVATHIEKIIKIAYDDKFLITVFTDSPEALDHIKKKSPDIVITDLVMPKIGGKDILRESKNLVKGIKVIIITAKQSVITAIGCFAGGADNFIFKPVGKNDVIRAIDHCKQNIDDWNTVIKSKL